MVRAYFDDYDSYNDLLLILNKNEIEAPTVKTNLVDIVGASGFLDLTEAFGEPKYNNRKLKMDFTMLPSVAAGLVLHVYSNLLTNIHGKKMKVIYPNNTTYYYYGRVDVGPLTYEKGIPKIAIEVDCDPYKYKTSETVNAYTFQGSYQFILSNEMMRVVPEISSNKRITLEYENNPYTHNAGTFKIPEIEIKQGSNYVMVSCDTNTTVATVSFTYREGRL